MPVSSVSLIQLLLSEVSVHCGIIPERVPIASWCLNGVPDSLYEDENAIVNGVPVQMSTEVPAYLLCANQAAYKHVTASHITFPKLNN